MVELLKTYSVEEIIIFIVMIALAVKGVLSFSDWIKDRINRDYSKRNQDAEERRVVKETLQSHTEAVTSLSDNQKKLTESLEKMNKSIELLVKSDKDDIKAYITEKHHLFCYDKGWIDDYSLDCLERRFLHYIEEGGNSYIKSLMEEIRALPKKSPEEKAENKKVS